MADNDDDDIGLVASIYDITDSDGEETWVKCTRHAAVHGRN